MWGIKGPSIYENPQWIKHTDGQSHSTKALCNNYNNMIKATSRFLLTSISFFQNAHKIVKLAMSSMSFIEGKEIHGLGEYNVS